MCCFQSLFFKHLKHLSFSVPLSCIHDQCPYHGYIHKGMKKKTLYINSIDWPLQRPQRWFHKSVGELKRFILSPIHRLKLVKKWNKFSIEFLKIKVDANDSMSKGIKWHNTSMCLSPPSDPIIRQTESLWNSLSGPKPLCIHRPAIKLIIFTYYS